MRTPPWAAWSRLRRFHCMYKDKKTKTAVVVTTLVVVECILSIIYLMMQLLL